MKNNLPFSFEFRFTLKKGQHYTLLYSIIYLEYTHIKYLA